MKVGFNLIYLVPNETGGMKTYAAELIREIVKLRPDLEYCAFINKETAAAQYRPWPEQVKTITVPVNASNRFAWVFGEQFLLPRLATKAGVDLLHSLGNTAPRRGKFKQITTIHDLNYMLLPDHHSRLFVTGMRFLVPLAAKHSDHVLTVSEASATDLKNLLKLPADKVSVTLNGFGQAGADLMPTPEAELRERYDLSDRAYILTVSAKTPHKNLKRLLTALNMFPQDERPILVMPGHATAHEEELKAYARELGIETDVRFLNWLELSELEGLYLTANCFAFPSIQEGFGLPILEAMSRGLPVCCADRGAMAEVAGDAALTFNPEDPAAIAEAVKTLLTDKAVSDQLKVKGQARAKEFTWQRTAEQTLAVYEKLFPEIKR